MSGVRYPRDHLLRLHRRQHETPAAQIEAFRNACVEAVTELEKRDADLLVVGNAQSVLVPKELLRYTTNPNRRGPHQSQLPRELRLEFGPLLLA